MKKSMFLVVALASAGLASPAFAEDVCGDMCIDDFSKVTIGGNATFGGFGATEFTGAEGLGEVTKTGYSFVETVVNVTGDLCGVDCQSGSFAFTGASGEQVDVTSWAKGSTPGETVSAINEGGAFSNVTFTFGKMGISPAQ
jgi:hypothetical protein